MTMAEVQGDGCAEVVRCKHDPGPTQPLAQGHQVSSEHREVVVPVRCEIRLTVSAQVHGDDVEAGVRERAQSPVSR